MSIKYKLLLDLPIFYDKNKAETLICAFKETGYIPEKIFYLNEVVSEEYPYEMVEPIGSGS